MNAVSSIPPTANTPAVSVREKSTADLTQAIHSPGDEAYVLDRTRICLKAFYEPDMSHEDRAAVMDEFARALRGYPRWAVSRGFDGWMKAGTRRPSPGDIVILAGRAIQEITDELKRRDRIAEQQAEDDAPPRCSADMSARLMAQAGFTPKRLDAVRRAPMALTFSEADAIADTPSKPHWTETVAKDSPDMERLRKARAENPMIRAAMDAARQSGGEA